MLLPEKNGASATSIASINVSRPYQAFPFAAAGPTGDNFAKGRQHIGAVAVPDIVRAGPFCPSRSRYQQRETWSLVGRAFHKRVNNTNKPHIKLAVSSISLPLRCGAGDAQALAAF